MRWICLSLTGLSNVQMYCLRDWKVIICHIPSLYLKTPKNHRITTLQSLLAKNQVFGDEMDENLSLTKGGFVLGRVDPQLLHEVSSLRSRGRAAGERFNDFVVFGFVGFGSTTCCGLFLFSFWFKVVCLVFCGFSVRKSFHPQP